MAKVSKETKEAIEGLIKEIVAGKVLHPRDRKENGWNEACDRAHNIAHKYSIGEGIFQQ